MKHPFRIATSIATALVVAACAMPPDDGDADTRAVSGDLMLSDEVDLPADAELVVTFRGLQGEVLAEERRRVGDREPPYAFDLLIPADRIGTVLGRVEADDLTTWQSVSVLLDQGTNSVDLGTLALDPVNASFAPAAGIAAETQPDLAAGEDLAEPRAGAGAMEEMPEAGAAVAQAPAESGPIRLRCGESQITVAQADGGADVTVGETVVEMQAAGAGGDGRRYAVPDDPATYVSLEGDAAEVSLAGAVFPDCTIVSRAE